MTRRLIEHHGLSTCAESFGDPGDPTLLMVMGAGSTMLRYEDDFVAGFTTAGYHVIRYDQRDVGQSTCGTPGEVDYTVRELVEDAFEVPRFAEIVGEEQDFHETSCAPCGGSAALASRAARAASRLRRRYSSSAGFLASRWSSRR